MKCRTVYFFNDLIHIKDFDLNGTEIDKKLYKNVIIYYLEYITIKNLSYTKNNSLNHFNFVFNYVGIYIEKIQFHYVWEHFKRLFYRHYGKNSFYRYGFSVDYDAMAIDDILDIHQYLMKNNNRRANREYK